MSGNEESAARPVGSAEELVKDEERERKRAAIKARIEAQKKAEDVQRIDERYGSFFIEPKPDEDVFHPLFLFTPTTQTLSPPCPRLTLPFCSRRLESVWVSDTLFDIPRARRISRRIYMPHANSSA